MVDISYSVHRSNPVLQVYRWIQDHSRIAVVSFAILYLILSFSYPCSRDFFDWQRNTEGVEKNFIHIMFQLMFGLSAYPILLIPLVNSYEKFRNRMNWFCEKVVVKSLVLALIACLVLTAFHVVGWWWTWLTIGVQLCIPLLAYIILKNRAHPIEALIIGIGLMGISIGLWEIPYQIGLGYIWNQHQAIDTINQAVIREVAYELPFIIGGIIILAIYQDKYKLLSFNKWFWFFMSSTVGLYLTWFLTGFWVEMTFDIEADMFIQHPVNMTARTIYRASKVALALGLVALILKKKGEACNEQL